MSETLSVHLPILADSSSLILYLHNSTTGALLNTGGDALAHITGRLFNAVLEEDRSALGHLYAVVCEGTELPENVVWDGWLQAGQTVIVSDYPVVASGSPEEIAMSLLLLDWTTIVDIVPARSALNAFRHIRNRWEIIGTDKTVYKEDDLTPAYTTVVTAGPDGEILADRPNA